MKNLLIALALAFALALPGYAQAEPDSSATITISIKEYERLKTFEEGADKEQFWKMSFEQILDEEGNDVSDAWELYEYWVLRTVRLDGAVAPGRVDSLISEIETLNQIGDEPITLVVNSPGGGVASGLNLINAMESSAAPIHTVCDSWAMSMAAVVAAAGDRRVAAEGCVFMVHEVAVGAPGGQSIDHIKWTDGVITVEEQLVSLLSKYSGLSKSDVRTLMEYETFWDAEEATRLGFFDEHRSGSRDHGSRAIPEDLLPENRMRRNLTDKLNR